MGEKTDDLLLPCSLVLIKGEEEYLGNDGFLQVARAVSDQWLKRKRSIAN